MGLNRILVLLSILVGISVAQDTNFPLGPQYLATNGNPLLLRPIATPSLSLSGETLAGTSEVPGIVEVPSFAPLETVTYLDNVYWGPHKPEEVVARRMETPVMNPSDTAWYMNLVASQVTSPPLQVPAETTEAVSGPTVIELTGGPMPSNLPPSIADGAALGTTGSQIIWGRGDGTSLGDAAAHWKSHKRTAARVFTNVDVMRLRG